jgi:hypothetical protein
MKIYGQVAVYLNSFLISALDGGDRSTWRTDRFIPEKEPPVHIG